MCSRRAESDHDARRNDTFNNNSIAGYEAQHRQGLAASIASDHSPNKVDLSTSGESDALRFERQKPWDYYR
ncbi:MAG: hypothetical protein SGPRY_006613 [Prymnesium sp.]